MSTRTHPVNNFLNIMMPLFILFRFIKIRDHVLNSTNLVGIMEAKKHNCTISCQIFFGLYFKKIFLQYF